MATVQMREILTAWWEVLTRKRALGATAELLRIFLVCTACGRVVPYYRLVARSRGVRHCRCGNATVRPGAPSYWSGAAWVLGALAWRKWIRRLGDAWDPRAPIRASEMGSRKVRV
jgi:hypothetical protein